MRIDTIQLVYFSPTGTSKRVVEGIARAFQDTPTERLDFTLPITTQSVYSVLLMIPIGALVIVLLRNFIGIKT